MSGVADNASDLAEVRVRHAGVRRLIAGDIEQVEPIHPELELVLTPKVERLDDRHVDVLEARSRKCTGSDVAKVILRLCGENAGITSCLLSAERKFGSSSLDIGSIKGIDGTVGPS